MRSVFIEVFSNKDDADYWMQKHIEEHQGWSIIEAEVKFIREGSWRAGLLVSINEEQTEMSI